MNTSEAKTLLDTQLSDTLTQVSADRITNAINSAWKDMYVAVDVIDDSITYDSSQYEYTIPDTLTTVDSVLVKYSSTDTPQTIDSSLWEVSNNSLILTAYAGNYLTDGCTLVLRGKYKLTTADEIPDTNPALQEYVINLASWIILKNMGFTKVLSFLQNDTSMSELIGFRRELERDIKSYRMQLSTSYVDN